jgi:thymidylate synthase
MSLEEQQYLDLVRAIIEKGAKEPHGRNGATRSLFGHTLRFSLKNGTWPLLTTKRMAWKTCAHELFWFLRGQTDNAILQEKGVHIWDENASREFLDGRGLHHYPEGTLGPIYGFQWRHWNSEYMSGQGSNQGHGQEHRDPSSGQGSNQGHGQEHRDPSSGQGIDQLAEVIRQLQDTRLDGGRTSRRLIVTAWNPEQLDQMALPPCHVLMQFSVRDHQYLSCALYQRSGDVGLGVPFNIASYSLLTHLLAHHCGLIADEFIHFLGNAHVYEEHVDALTLQMQRIPEHPFPTIRIAKQTPNIEEYDIEDVVFVTPYQHASTISMKMIA